MKYSITYTQEKEDSCQKMERLICLFGKWYNSEILKYKTYCTNNTLEDDKLWQEKKKYWKQHETM